MSYWTQFEEPLTVNDLETLADQLNEGTDVLPEELQPKERSTALRNEEQKHKDERDGLQPTTDELATGLQADQAETFDELYRSNEHDVKAHHLATYFVICTDVQLTNTATDLI